MRDANDFLVLREDGVPAACVPVVRVNGEPHAWHAALTVAALVQQCRADDAGVANAVNGQFVARQARATTRLAPGDALLVFGAIVGG